MSGCDKHAAGVTYLCLCLNLWPHHEPRCIDKTDDRQSKVAAQTHKPCGFVCGICVNGTSKMQRIAYKQTNRTSLDARKCSVNAPAKAGSQLKHAVNVGNGVQYCATVIRTQSILGNHIRSAG